MDGSDAKISDLYQNNYKISDKNRNFDIPN